MLNGSNKSAPIAGEPLPDAVGAATSERERSNAQPERLGWFVLPAITFASALAGGAAAWLTQ